MYEMLFEVKVVGLEDSGGAKNIQGGKKHWALKT